MTQRSITARNAYGCPAPLCGGRLWGWGAGGVVVAFLHLLSFCFIFILFLLSSVDHDPMIHLVNRWDGSGLGGRRHAIGEGDLASDP